MSGNKSLRTAERTKEDEFYTQLTDIEKELRHYKQHFRGKTILCNCDDPFENCQMLCRDCNLKKGNQ